MIILFIFCFVLYNVIGLYLASNIFNDYLNIDENTNVNRAVIISLPFGPLTTVLVYLSVIRIDKKCRDFLNYIDEWVNEKEK